jgi:hypothetical protein
MAMELKGEFDRQITQVERGLRMHDGGEGTSE